MTRPRIPDDVPTEPDPRAMPCPCCKEAGGFLVGTPGGAAHRRCDFCGGERRVSLKAWRTYRESHR